MAPKAKAKATAAPKVKATPVNCKGTVEAPVLRDVTIRPGAALAMHSTLGIAREDVKVRTSRQGRHEKVTETMARRTQFSVHECVQIKATVDEIYAERLILLVALPDYTVPKFCL